MHRVLITGYGRFGAAFSTLLSEAGLEVRAYDEFAHVPPGLTVRSLGEGTRAADLVVVAVPVPAMAASFSAIRPFLSAEQTVVDVGSVKWLPAKELDAVFGTVIPWVATHPLFGPLSLARGERPRRVVVCPNARHPGAVEAIKTLFERLDCQVLLQTPEEHDRVMAFTHALAFFMAKGMLDAGVPTDITYAPPSFQGIMRTIESVRADAGHLFAALHQQNPFAGEARRKLLDALTAADYSLAHEEMTPSAHPEAFNIPDLGAQSPELKETRDVIDEIDREIVGLLARRGELARKAAAAKARAGKGIYDPAREVQLLSARQDWAKESGLDPAAIAEVFQSILRFSRRAQVDRPPETQNQET